MRLDRYNGKSFAILMDDETKIGVARRRITRYLDQLGCDSVFVSEVAIIVMELSVNLMKHALGKKMLIFRSTLHHQRQNIEVISIDEGPYIEQLKEALKDGFSTQGTLGIGLGSVKRLSDKFDYYSVKDMGNVFIAQKYTDKLKPAASTHKNFDFLCAPVEGVHECGDDIAIDMLTESGMRLMMTDGMGHGERAQDSCTLAREVFFQHPEMSLKEVIKTIDHKIKDIRGLDMLLMDIVEEGGRAMVNCAAVGNISVYKVDIGGREVARHVPNPGKVGYQIYNVKEASYSLAQGEVLIAHTDGMLPLKGFCSKLLGLPSTVIASSCFLKSSIPSDDSSIFVYKNATS